MAAVASPPTLRLRPGTASPRCRFSSFTYSYSKAIPSSSSSKHLGNFHVRFSCMAVCLVGDLVGFCWWNSPYTYEFQLVERKTDRQT